MSDSPLNPEPSSPPPESSSSGGEEEGEQDLPVRDDGVHTADEIALEIDAGDPGEEEGGEEEEVAGEHEAEAEGGAEEGEEGEGEEPGEEERGEGEDAGEDEGEGGAEEEEEEGEGEKLGEEEEKEDEDAGAGAEGEKIEVDEEPGQATPKVVSDEDAPPPKTGWDKVAMLIRKRKLGKKKPDDEEEEEEEEGEVRVRIKRRDPADVVTKEEAMAAKYSELELLNSEFEYMEVGETLRTDSPLKAEIDSVNARIRQFVSARIGKIKASLAKSSEESESGAGAEKPGSDSSEGGSDSSVGPSTLLLGEDTISNFGRAIGGSDMVSLADLVRVMRKDSDYQRGRKRERRPKLEEEEEEEGEVTPPTPTPEESLESVRPYVLIPSPFAKKWRSGELQAEIQQAKEKQLGGGAKEEIVDRSKITLEEVAEEFSISTEGAEYVIEDLRNGVTNGYESSLGRIALEFLYEVYEYKMEKFLETGERNSLPDLRQEAFRALQFRWVVGAFKHLSRSPKDDRLVGLGARFGYDFDTELPADDSKRLRERFAARARDMAALHAEHEAAKADEEGEVPAPATGSPWSALLGLGDDKRSEADSETSDAADQQEEESEGEEDEEGQDSEGEYTEEEEEESEGDDEEEEEGESYSEEAEIDEEEIELDRILVDSGSSDDYDDDSDHDEEAGLLESEVVIDVDADDEKSEDEESDYVFRDEREREKHPFWGNREPLFPLLHEMFSEFFEDEIPCCQWPNWNQVGLTLFQETLPPTMVSEDKADWTRVVYFRRKNMGNEQDWPVLTHVYLVQNHPPYNKFHKEVRRTEWYPLRAKVQCYDVNQKPIRLGASLSTENYHAQDIQSFLVKNFRRRVAYIRVIFWSERDPENRYDPRYRDDLSHEQLMMAYIKNFGFLGLPPAHDTEMIQRTLFSVCDDPICLARLRPEVRAKAGLRCIIYPNAARLVMTRGGPQMRLMPKYGKAICFGCSEYYEQMDVYRELIHRAIRDPIVFVLGKDSFYEWASAQFDWHQTFGTSDAIPGAVQVYNLVHKDHLSIFTFIHLEDVVVRKHDIRVFSLSHNPDSLLRELTTRVADMRKFDPSESIRKCVELGACTRVVTKDAYLSQKMFVCRACGVTKANMTICEACAETCHRNCRIADDPDDVEAVVFESGISPSESICGCCETAKCHLKNVKPKSGDLPPCQPVRGFDGLLQAVLSCGEAELKLQPKDLSSGDLGEWIDCHRSRVRMVLTGEPASALPMGNEFDGLIGLEDEESFSVEERVEAMDKMFMKKGFDEAAQVLSCGRLMWSLVLTFFYSLLHTVRMRWYMFGIVTLFVKLSSIYSIVALVAYLGIDFVLTWLILNRKFFIGFWNMSCYCCCPSRRDGKFSTRKCCAHCTFPYHGVFEYVVKYEYLAEHICWKLVRLLVCLFVMVVACFLAHYLIIYKRTDDIVCYRPYVWNGTVFPNATFVNSTYGILSMFGLVYQDTDEKPSYCDVKNSDILDYYKVVLLGLISAVLMMLSQVSYDGPMSRFYFEYLLKLEKKGVFLLRAVRISPLNLLKTTDVIFAEVLNGLYWMRTQSIAELDASVVLNESQSHLDLSYFQDCSAFDMGMLQYFFVDVLRDIDESERAERKHERLATKDPEKAGLLVQREDVESPYDLRVLFGLSEDWWRLVLILVFVGIALLVALLFLYVIAEIALISANFFYTVNMSVSFGFTTAGIRRRMMVYGIVFGVVALLLFVIGFVTFAFGAKIEEQMKTLNLALRSGGYQSPFAFFMSEGSSFKGFGKYPTLRGRFCCRWYRLGCWRVCAFIQSLLTMGCAACCCSYLVVCCVPCWGLALILLCGTYAKAIKKGRVNFSVRICCFLLPYVWVVGAALCSDCCCLLCNDCCRRESKRTGDMDIASHFLLHRSHAYLRKKADAARNAIGRTLDNVSSSVLNQVPRNLVLADAYYSKDTQGELDVNRVFRFARVLKMNRVIVSQVAKRVVDLAASKDLVKWERSRKPMMDSISAEAKGLRTREADAARKEADYCRLLKEHAFQIGQWFIMVCLFGGSVPPTFQKREDHSTKGSLWFHVSDSSVGELWRRMYDHVEDGHLVREKMIMSPVEIENLRNLENEGIHFRFEPFRGGRALIPVMERPAGMEDVAWKSSVEVRLREIWNSFQEVDPGDEDEILRGLRRRSASFRTLAALGEFLEIQ